MAWTISMKPVMSSTSKPNIKPITSDKPLGIYPVICFCEIEDSSNTDEGEEA